MSNHTPFNELIQQDKPVLVDFFATWCGPCKALAPVLKQVKDSLGDRIRIIKIDVDQNPNAARTYSVRGVPTMILFKQGEIVWRKSGAMQANRLLKNLEPHL